MDIFLNIYLTFVDFQSFFKLYPDQDRGQLGAATVVTLLQPFQCRFKLFRKQNQFEKNAVQPVIPQGIMEKK